MSNRLASSLGTISPGGKTRAFRYFDADGLEQILQVPLFVPDITSAAQNFSTIANLTLNAGSYYFKNFTINAGHQLILSPGITILYCSGTVTIGGNGITGILGTSKNLINLRNYATSQTITHGTSGGRSSIVGGNGGDGLEASAAGGGGGGTDGTARSGGNGGVGTDTHGGGGGGCGNDLSGATGGNGSGNGTGGTGGNGGAGGAAGTFGGNSQSSLFIIANNIVINGNINLNGGNGTNGSNGTSGGGGGGGGNGGDGGVLGLFARSVIHNSGAVTTNGGNAGDGANGSNGNVNEGAGGGGGGGAGGDAGMLIIQALNLSLLGGTRSSSAGISGVGGTGGFISGETGGNGGSGANGFTDTNTLLNLQEITGSPF